MSHRQKGARDNFSLQIRTLVEEAHKSLGNTPVLFGECGIPMDMNKGDAFVTEDFIWQKRMMDAMITGFDRALVGFNLWNYNPDNTDAEGDNWNGENFSWFSQRRAMPNFLLEYEQTSPHLDGGGRILDAVVRPYPAKVAGIPLEFNYELMNGELSFTWIIPEKGELQSHETEIFFPSLLASGRKLLLEAQIDISQYDYDDGAQAMKKLQSLTQEHYAYTYDENRQTLFIVPKDNSPGTKHSVRVRVWPPVRPLFNLNDVWTDFGIWIVAVIVVLIGILAAALTTIGAAWIGYA